MNKLCVFSTNVKTYFMTRLINEVGQGLVIYNPRVDESLPEAKAVLVRTSGTFQDDHDLLELTKQRQTNIFNPIETLKIFRSKASQYEFFEQNKFSHLPWKKISDPLKLPEWTERVVVKPNRGQGGWGVRVLEKDDLYDWWLKQKNLGDLDYLLQPFMLEHQEFRVFFCGPTRITLKRKNASSVAANFNSGGDAERSSLPAMFLPEIERLIKLSGAIYGAIDLFIKDQQLIILELNTVPGIEQLEKVSGANIIQLLLTEIVS